MDVIGNSGYCEDWVYLNEGGYPEKLTEISPLYDPDPVKECMNRCLNDFNNGILGMNGHMGAGATPIGNRAILIRESDNGCCCSSGVCTVLLNSVHDYTAYTITDNRIKFFFSNDS